MTSAGVKWRVGDRVIHAGRPEWGPGKVTRAETTKESGREAQRLTIRFDRVGTKTISTAFAELKAADAGSAVAGSGGWLDELEGRAGEERLHRVPEAARDPFKTPGERLDATLGLYRFHKDGAVLLDWAAAQLGVADPLTLFSRQDLERHFDRFRRNLDDHLTKLVSEVHRSYPELLAKAARDAEPRALQALRRANQRR